jgi:hypothetical protein
LKISFIATLLISLSGCVSGPIPEWDGKLFAGDSSRGALVRAQSGEVISAHSPEFDEYVAMSYADFELFYKTYVLGCERWRPNVKMISEQEARAQIRDYARLKRD